MDALQKAPGQMRVHHNLGLHFQELKRWGEAVSYYEKALQSPETHRKDEALGPLYQLGQVHAEMGDRRKAIFWYLEAIQMDPGFSPALVNLAALFDKEGDRDKADLYLLKAMEANPADAHVNLNMGIYCLRKGLGEKAIDFLLKSATQGEVRGQALMYLGIAYKQKGWLAQAAGCFQEAAILNPKDLRPRLHLIEVFARIGHETSARREAAEVVRIIDRDERLRQETLNLIVNQGQQNDVALSQDILLPLLSAPEQEAHGIRKDLNVAE
jgi:tetratricopeptide (TPR) repeat protein